TRLRGDRSSDVCSSDLHGLQFTPGQAVGLGGCVGLGVGFGAGLGVGFGVGVAVGFGVGVAGGFGVSVAVGFGVGVAVGLRNTIRSEERRVGKECKSRWR